MSFNLSINPLIRLLPTAFWCFSTVINILWLFYPQKNNLSNSFWSIICIMLLWNVGIVVDRCLKLKSILIKRPHLTGIVNILHSQNIYPNWLAMKETSMFEESTSSETIVQCTVIILSFAVKL
ncbi:hypothetical protein HZS_540 [Henneguya salminicola]|nr:hypothetical protein HZS_540 [Henneguya salminicola]